MKLLQVRGPYTGPAVPDQSRCYLLELQECDQQTVPRDFVIWVQLPADIAGLLEFKLAENVLTINEADQGQLQPSNLVRDGIIGNSRQLQTTLDQVAVAAESEQNVLVRGETGTGKELFARAVHLNSRRANERFIMVDCRSLPEAIAEKMLLGQPNQSRFGAPGLLPQASYGTLFLDEVGDLPVATQQLIQQLLSEQRYRPLGTRRDIPVSFRVIAATNRNLRQLVSQGKFNPELLEMLQRLSINIPPLRERHGDIELLTDFLLQRICHQKQLPSKQVSPEFRDLLKKYPWPGNVRELENSLEQALLAARNKKTLFPKDLPAHIRVQVKKSIFRKATDPQEEAGGESFFTGFFMADNPI